MSPSPADRSSAPIPPISPPRTRLESDLRGRVLTSDFDKETGKCKAVVRICLTGRSTEGFALGSRWHGARERPGEVR